jgi:DNA-binding MarR family transcriptional regulator
VIDPKSQLNLFGKAKRAPVVAVDVGPVEPPPAEPITEASKEPTKAVSSEAVDAISKEAVAVDSPEPAAVEAEQAAVEESPVEAEDSSGPASLEPVPSMAEADSATLVAEEPKSAAVLPGLRPPTGAQYLFPPSDERRRVDMRFSRRMSDLIRRLQLLEREGKADLGLTLPQAHAIHALDTAGSLRMQELAATLGLAQSTVTRLVAPLKRMGLLDRRPDRNDGRATRAYLTDRGKLSVDKLEAADRDLYRGLLDRIPPMRRAEVVAAIELLHEVTLSVARGED